MKRNSITEIIYKSQLLSVIADRFTNDYCKRTVTENSDIYHRYLTRIRRAAVNEIIRLDSTPVPSVHDLANKPGAASAFDQVIDALGNIHGSGYENLKK